MPEFRSQQEGLLWSICVAQRLGLLPQIRLKMVWHIKEGISVLLLLNFIKASFLYVLRRVGKYTYGSFRFSSPFFSIDPNFLKAPFVHASRAMAVGTPGSLLPDDTPKAEGVTLCSEATKVLL